MKRSKSIKTPLVVSTAALILAGCHGSEARRCIDNSGRVLSDVYCTSGSSYVGYPHWVYGGSSYYSGGHWFLHNYSSHSSYGGSGSSGSTSRGGFGSSGHSGGG